MSQVKDISGKRFKSVVVLERTGSNHLGHAKWLCRCDCGNIFTTLSNRLLTGNTGTCGCRNGHGMRYSRIYRTWVNMKARCLNPREQHFKRYGGRGIRICDEWRKNFQSFYDWALDNGYSEILTIDRINTDGNYEPNNCQWLTNSENARKK